MSKHTPGPWETATQAGQTRAVKLPNGEVWGVLKPRAYSKDQWGDHDIHAADARLIAAAPEMLERLRESLAALDTCLATGSDASIAKREAAREGARALLARLEGDK